MTEKEETELIDSILKTLNGLTVAQACDLLDSTKRRLQCGSVYVYSEKHA